MPAKPAPGVEPATIATTTIRLRFDGRSTVVRLRFDSCRPTAQPAMTAVTAPADDGFVRPLF